MLFTIFPDEGDHTGGPAVAQAVPEALVAEGTKVTVNILLTILGKLIDSAGIFCPIHGKILPKGGGTLIQHGTVVVLHHADGSFFVKGGYCLENIVAHKGGHSLGTAVNQPLFIFFVQLCSKEFQSCYLLAVGGADGDQLQPLQQSLCFAGVALKALQKPDGFLYCNDVDGSCPMQLIRLMPGRPIHKIPGIVQSAILQHMLVQLGNQTLQVGNLPLGKGSAAGSFKVILQNDHPPHGIHGVAVHPAGQGRLILNEV